MPERLASRTCSAARCASARVRCIVSAASIACIRDSWLLACRASVTGESILVGRVTASGVWVTDPVRVFGGVTATEETVGVTSPGFKLAPPIITTIAPSASTWAGPQGSQAQRSTGCPSTASLPMARARSVPSTFWASMQIAEDSGDTSARIDWIRPVSTCPGPTSRKVEAPHWTISSIISRN